MKIKVKVQDLVDSKLLYCLPSDIAVEIITSNAKYVSLDEKILSEAEKELNHRNEFNKLLYEIASLNNKGIQYEKSGMIKLAIIEYEKCMEVMYEGIKKKVDKSIAWHSPDRLRVLYKREKHPREKEFLNEFISFCLEHGIKYPEIYARQLKK